MEAEIIPNFKEIDNVENGNESLTSSNYYLNHIDRVKLVNVFEVVEKGNLEEIKNLGDTFGWIIFNQSDEKGLGVLHHCCKNFDISVFIFILTHSQCSKSNELIYDVMQNKSSSLKFDPCLRTKSEDKSAPIHVACKYGNTQLVELLLNIGISLELTDARGKTPLLVASYSQKIETVIYLVSAGANIFAEDIELDTCLHWAAYKGNVDLIDYFLNLGLDVNKLDSFNQTPVHLVCTCGNVRALDAILKAKPDLNIKDDKGRTPVELAFVKKNSPAVRRLKTDSNSIYQRIINIIYPFGYIRFYVISLFMYFVLSVFYDTLGYVYNGFYFYFLRTEFIFFVMITVITLYQIRKCIESPHSFLCCDKKHYKKIILQPFTYSSLVVFFENNYVCHPCATISEKSTFHCPYAKRCVSNYDEYDLILNLCITKRTRNNFAKLYFCCFIFYVFVLYWYIKTQNKIQFCFLYLWPTCYFPLRLAVLAYGIYNNIPSYKFTHYILTQKYDT